MQIEDWNDLRLLLALSRAQTLADAARALHVDTSTVSRRLVALERLAGRPLVRRGSAHEGTRLTPAGLELSSLAADVERAVLKFERWPENTRTRVRVTAPEELVSLLLAPALPVLARQTPWVEVDLLGTAQLLDLRAGEADLALRMSRPRDAGLSSRKLATIHYSTWAAGLTAPERWLTLDDSVGPWPELAWTRARLGGQRPLLRATSPGALAAAAGAGLGRAILPDALAALDPRLRCLEPNVGQRTLWLVMPAALRTDAGVRAVIQWVVDAVRTSLPA